VRREEKVPVAPFRVFGLADRTNALLRATVLLSD
jgi:hypothetical protein